MASRPPTACVCIPIRQHSGDRDLAIETTPNPPVFPESPVLRVQIKYTMGTDMDVLPRFFLEFSGGPPTAAALVTFATNFLSQWQNQISIYTGSWMTQQECIVQDVTTATGFEGIHTQQYTGSRTGC